MHQLTTDRRPVVKNLLIAWQVECLICIAVLTLSGCTAVQGVREHIAYNDTVDDFVLAWRNGAWAHQAWHMRKAQFLGHPYLHDFGEGFKAGYRDVASGGSGCTPPLPPRKYWNWRYQTAEGQAKVAAWFEGYPHGARAAEEDGAGLHRNIQTSELLRAEYRLGHEPPYKAPLYFHNPENWCPPGESVPPGTGQPTEPGVPPATAPGKPERDSQSSRAPSAPPSTIPAHTATGYVAFQANSPNRLALPTSNESLQTESGDPYTLLPWAHVVSTTNQAFVPAGPIQPPPVGPPISKEINN